jgi:hypothetical protein
MVGSIVARRTGSGYRTPPEEPTAHRYGPPMMKAPDRTGQGPSSPYDVLSYAVLWCAIMDSNHEPAD